MKPFLRTLLLFSCIAGCSSPAAEPPSPFLAYSLREAALRAESGKANPELLTLGGITRVAGMVYDRKGNDVILVGLAAPDLPEVHFDDLVVALRARLVHGEWPLVSIDPLPDSDRTKLQRVRFDGHIEDTSFGRDFLDCDILLKLYSLQMVKNVAAVRPYNLLVEDGVRAAVERGGAEVLAVRWCRAEDGVTLARTHEGMAVSGAYSYQARFWFYVLEPYVYAHKGDVFCIKDLRLALQSESGPEDDPQPQDEPRKRFSEEWTEHFPDVCREYPTLRKLKALYDLLAVAEAVRTLGDQPYLHYLLDGYAVPPAPTDKDCKLEELYGLVERSDGLRHLLRISGGIELTSEVKFLNAGNVAQLRSVVIGSRPSAGALTWPLPLADWRMPNAKDIHEPRGGVANPPSHRVAGKKGCSVLLQSVLVDPKPLDDNSIGKRFSGFPPNPPPPPPLRGVSMRMTVAEDSFEPAQDGRLEELRGTAIETRPSSDTLSWPARRKGDSSAETKR